MAKGHSDSSRCNSRQAGPRAPCSYLRCHRIYMELINWILGVKSGSSLKKLGNHFQNEHFGKANSHLLTNYLKIQIFVCEVWQKSRLCVSPSKEIEHSSGRAVRRPPNPAVPKPMEPRYDSKGPFHSVGPGWSPKFHFLKFSR